MNSSIPVTLIVSLSLLIMAGCSGITEYKQHRWNIAADISESTLDISREGLGRIAFQVRLNLQMENGVVPLSGWRIAEESDKLSIEAGDTYWEFVLSEIAIDVTCSDQNGLISGLSPAGEARIPARIASQDNGIIFSQMGFVSATHIHSLFDMPTDTLIQFTQSKLTRNEEDVRLMDIQVPVGDGREIILLQDYYTDIIGLSKHQVTDFKPVYKPYSGAFKTAHVGWDSWYCYYYLFNQDHLVAEADAVAEKLSPYGVKSFMVDAGYTRGEEANWLEWNEEWYPKGGEWCFDYIREKGLKPGIWLNPEGSNYPKPEMAEKYPEEFYLRDSNGNLAAASFAFDWRFSPQPTVVKLDLTHPLVMERHLRPLLRTLVDDWGLTHVKNDGWGRYMDYYEENRKNAHESDMDSRQVFINMEALVREEMGRENYIGGICMHEVGLEFGLYDGSRMGPDNYGKWDSSQLHGWAKGMKPYFDSLFGANYLNGICLWADPDDVMIRDPLTMDEAVTIVSSISLSGQQYLISDFIAEFSEDRVHDLIDSEFLNRAAWISEFPELVKALPDTKLELYAKTLPTMPIKAIDLYPFRCGPIRFPEPTEYPRALDLKVNSKSGIYDVVAVYNWDDEDAVKIIHLHEDLGLERDTEYLVFDFWNTRFLGRFKGMIREAVPSHGTRALIIREAGASPQLLATSRHLTCAYSIQEMDWDSELKCLSGTSVTVPGDPYTLFFHVPEGYKFDEVLIDTDEVLAQVNANGLLEVGFVGREEPVNWEIQFE